jgi:hypothetical protein
MIRLKYPNSRVNLEASYLSKFSINPDVVNNYNRINGLLGNILPITLSELLIAPIETLTQIAFSITPNKGLIKVLKIFFKYEDYQFNIAEFFSDSKNKIDTKTCYYCNIDFINAFKDVGDYFDGLDFVKRGTKDELSKVLGIGTSKLTTIIRDRNNLTSLDELGFSPKVVANLNDLILNKKHNHFTLDHILNKAKHPIAALSLYNFVPCCYSCNSKFKKDRPLIIDLHENYLSPTYSNFDFNTNVKFKILFKNSITNHKLINNQSDYIVYTDILNNNTGYERYLNMFKLNGRYKSHKYLSFNLIEMSKNYSDSQINEIATITKHSVDKIRSNIFGTNLFDGNQEDKPFTKYLRDIADNIGIRNVKTQD